VKFGQMASADFFRDLKGKEVMAPTLLETAQEGSRTRPGISNDHEAFIGCYVSGSASEDPHRPCRYEVDAALSRYRLHQCRILRLQCGIPAPLSPLRLSRVASAETSLVRRPQRL
jgi:hypothetical protein